MGSTPTRPTIMQIFLLIALFIAVLAVIFAVQNNAPASVSFAFWDFEGSVALVLLISLAAGALMSFFVSLPSNIKARWTIRQQRKKMTEMEGSLASLREQLDLSEKKMAQLQGSSTPAAPAVLPAPASSDSNSAQEHPQDTPHNG